METDESTRARAVMDLEPGSRIVSWTARRAVGAVQCDRVGSAVVGGVALGTRPLCRRHDGGNRAGYGCAMCGRYASTRSAADLASIFEALDETDEQLRPDYNLAPTDPAPIVRVSTRTSSRVLTVARWGLVPAWSPAPTGGARMINARAETVASSRVFARSFAQRRCLVPADGWYEWRPLTGRAKQPYFMTRPDLVLGGIWSIWGTGSDRLLTFSVVTVPAEGPLGEIHDRMPLVLEPGRWDSWLTAADATGLLAPPPPDYVAGIELRPVSAAVGDVRNDGPELVRAVATPSLIESTVEPPMLF
jgi:putative SOS response-associated peptidase YedK